MCDGGVIIGTHGSHVELVQDVGGRHQHGNHIGLHQTQGGDHLKQLLLLTLIAESGAGQDLVTSLTGDDLVTGHLLTGRDQGAGDLDGGDLVKALLLTSGDHGSAELAGDVLAELSGDSEQPAVNSGIVPAIEFKSALLSTHYWNNFSSSNRLRSFGILVFSQVPGTFN